MSSNKINPSIISSTFAHNKINASNGNIGIENNLRTRAEYNNLHNVYNDDSIKNEWSTSSANIKNSTKFKATSNATICNPSLTNNCNNSNNNKCESLRRTYRKRSNVWLHFTKLSNKEAKCDACKKVFIYINCTTSNLLKHIKSKHPSLVGTIQSKVIKERVTIPAECYPSRKSKTRTTKKYPSRISISKIKTVTPDNFNGFVDEPASMSRQKNLNELLLKLVACDMQPCSIVNDRGFRTFINGLDPSYELPTKTTLSKNLLPNAYSEMLDIVKKELSHGETFTITIEEWTSISNDRYLAYTVHFIDEEFEMKNFLLESNRFCGPHTAENISIDILRVINDWNLTGKVEAIISDGASNMKDAIKLTGLNQFNCFAHTLNLIVHNCLNCIKPILNKVKHIVEYFNCSSDATEKLMAVQKQFNPFSIPIKLKNDDIKCWNSTFEMLDRFQRIREPLEATIAQLQEPAIGLNEEDWTHLNEICRILKRFNSLARELSCEKFVSVSKLLVVERGLRDRTVELLRTSTLQEITKFLKVMVEGVTIMFDGSEENYLLARATCLDPRFKNIGFSNESAFNRIKEKITKEISDDLIISADNIKVECSNNDKEDEDIWSEFDNKISKLICTPQASAILEVRKYLDEPYLDRNGCPLKWWNQRKHSFPLLSRLAKKALSIVATSIQCERVFSKRGQLFAERRSRLKPNNASMILFLNNYLNK